jgi:5-methylcytosine-specific restriction endonuclease McrA
MLKTCSKCHETKPVTEFHRNRSVHGDYHSHCKACKHAYDSTPEARARHAVIRRRWYENHRARAIEQALIWNATHPEARKVIEQRSYRKNRAARKAYHAQRYLAHKARLLADNRRHKASRHEYYLAQARLYRRAHLQRYAAHAALRRARKLQAPVVEKIDRAAIIARDRSICHICGLRVAPADMSLDHLIPLALGGEHSARNLAVAHILCNKKRGKGYLPAQLRLW